MNGVRVAFGMRLARAEGDRTRPAKNPDGLSNTVRKSHG